MSGTLSVCDLGPTPYREGVALQEALVRARAEERTGDWLLFADHPPVLTIGRGGSEASLRVDRDTLERLGIELVETSRGGDVTWHGPGQIVGYPIVALAPRGGDLHAYLRGLEGALIEALASWGIPSARVPGRTGVWCGDRKIASLGIAVRRWVAYHGFALNLDPDLSGFDLIHPCGLRGVRMTSVAERLGPAAPDAERARRDLADAVGRALGAVPVRVAREALPGSSRRIESDAFSMPAPNA